jgi:hypothetical protein
MRRLRRRAVRVTIYPQTGTAGMPEVARVFKCVNLFCGSDLDFSRCHAVSVRTRKTGCVRASRKHVDFAGLSSESVGGVFSRLQPQQQHQQVTSHFSVGDCTERGRQVKALRCAPTAEAARKKRAGLTRLPLRSCVAPLSEKM